MTLAYAHGLETPSFSEVAHSAARLATHAGPWTGPHISLFDWSLDPTFLVTFVLAVLYFKGFVRYRRQGGRQIPIWRAVLFGTGVAVIGIALMSPIDVLADYSFTFHMLQHELLMMVGAPLILLGAPFIPVVRGLPAGFRRRWFIPFARWRPARWVATRATRPLVALIIFEAVIVLWHMPLFYNLALYNDVIHDGLMHPSFVIAAMLFWWHIITPYPFRSRLHMFLRMAMLVASAIVNGAVGSLIALSSSVLYGYGQLRGFWGVSMLQEQHLGGLLMWIMGDMLRVVAITILFAVYVARENAKEPYARSAARVPAQSAATAVQGG